MKKTGQFKNCIKCTKSFWAYKYNFDKRLYCSTACANKSNAKKQSTTKRSKATYNLGDKPRQFDSWRYIEWRNFVLVRDNKICQNCKTDVSGKNEAIAHHIKPWREYPELRYDTENGITLCRGCHNIIEILPNRKINHGF